MRVASLALPIIAAVLASTPVAGAATPPLLWQGVERVGVQCLVVGDRGVDDGALRDSICARARAIASRDSPHPVDIVALGDPAILDAGKLTLLLHVSIERAGAGRLAALSIRPYRHSARGGELLFAAAPRAARVAEGGDVASALEPAIAAALAETLPWRALRPAPRPIQP